MSSKLSRHSREGGAGRLPELVSHELHKLLGLRYIWLLAALLLAANCIVAFAVSAPYRLDGIDADQITDFFHLCEQDPEGMQAYYDQMTSFQDEQSLLWVEAMRRGEEYELQKWEDRYGSGSYTDKLLFTIYEDAAAAPEQYRSDIGRVIRTARANLTELEYKGLPEDSYALRGQQKYIQVYQTVRDNVDIKVEYVHGWGPFLGYDTVNLFILLTLALFASVIFAEERERGFVSVLRTTRHGRATTALAKLAAGGIMCLGTVAAYFVTTMAVFGLSLGFSSPENAIQVLGDFTYCPYSITIGQYIALSLALRLLAALALTAVCLLLSALTGRYLAACAAGLGVVALSFFMYSFRLANANGVIRNLNLFAASAVKPLAVRYRSLELFGGVCGFMTLAVVGTAVLLMLGCAGALLVHVMGGTVRRSSRRNLFAKKSKSLVAQGDSTDSTDSRVGVSPRSAPSPARRTRIIRPRGLMWQECYKRLMASRMLLLLAAAIAMQLAVSYNDDGVVRSMETATEQVYCDYMTSLAGELTQQKQDYLREERQRINTALDIYDQMLLDYRTGQLSYDDYVVYLTEYNYASLHTEPLSRVEAYAQHLTALRERGIEAELVYDTGWNALLNIKPNFILIVLLMLLLSGSFADEYVGRSSSGAFAGILRTSTRGRGDTCRAKLGAAALLGAAVCVVLDGIDLIFKLSRVVLPSPGAAAQSILLLGDLGEQITLSQMAALIYFLRLAAALTLALLIAGISGLARRHIAVLSCSVGVTLLPFMLGRLGLGSAGRFDMTRYLSGAQLCLDSASWCGDLTGVVGFALCALVLTAAIDICAVWLFTRGAPRRRRRA